MENKQATLTRGQQELYAFLRERLSDFPQPPTLNELCRAMGLKSRGSLHKQLQALIDAGLVAPMNRRQRGVHLIEAPATNADELPFLGTIAAGHPIEAVTQPETIAVPEALRTARPCYVLQVRGESMVEDGILDGDWVVIERRDHARNGEVVVALIDGSEATLKRIEQKPGEVLLHPANSALETQRYRPEQVRIQGVVVGQMRRYR